MLRAINIGYHKQSVAVILIVSSRHLDATNMYYVCGIEAAAVVLALLYSGHRSR